MIVGMYRVDKDAEFPNETLISMKSNKQSGNGLVTSYEHSHLKIAYEKDNLASRNDMDGIYVSADKKMMVACEGNLFNANELQKLLNLQNESQKHGNAGLVSAIIRSITRRMAIVWKSNLPARGLISSHMKVRRLRWQAGLNFLLSDFKCRSRNECMRYVRFPRLG